MKPIAAHTTARAIVFLLLCVVVVVGQHGYDAAHERQVLPDKVPSADLIKAFDLGLHSIVAGIRWLDVRTELPFLPEGPEHFIAGLKLVNELDPHWSEPYAFTVLVLPSLRWYEERLPQALAAGERGLAAADPDWRIPFYMAATYQLELDDHENAVLYYDRAAATPGVPETVRRFAVNYGIRLDLLRATKQIWVAIYETSPDEAVRHRAAEHVAHLEILEYLNSSVQSFRAQHGRYPEDLDEVIQAGVIPEVPQSPFGFDFTVRSDGVVGVAQ